MKKKKTGEPQYIKSSLNNDMINYKVYKMSKGESIIARLICFAAGGIAGLIFYGGLFKADGAATTATHISDILFFVLMGSIASKLFVPGIKNYLKEKRANKLQRQFMDMLETLSVSLSAGNTVNDSFMNAKNDMRNQYSQNDMIIIELNEIISGIENGITLEEMLLNFGSRSCNEDIENFSNVISNCFRLGGDFREVVRKTRDIIIDKIAVSSEIDTKLASNKMQLNVMCFMPVALIGMLKLTNVNFAANLASFTGIVATTVAIGIFVASYFWGRKIINIR